MRTSSGGSEKSRDKNAKENYSGWREEEWDSNGSTPTEEGVSETRIK